MTQHITRISYDDFARDIPGVLDRVTKSGDRFEVLWGDGSVVLLRQGTSHADEMDQSAEATPATLSPVDFFAEAKSRPDVAEVLRQLAK